MGRFLSEENEQSGAGPPLVVSYRFWANHLGSDPSIVGRTLRVNGHACTVIGVGPKEFLGASPMIFVADLWLPLSVGERIAPELAGNALERRDRTMFQFVARLRPRVTSRRAEAAMDTVTRQFLQAYGEDDKTQKGRQVRLSTGGRLVPVREQDLGLFLAFPAVLLALILLIACSNVANMMLARAAARRREIAVRLSLGASRARLVRQLLTESMLVSMSAGILGFLLTMWLMHLYSQSPSAAFQVGVNYGTPVTFHLEPEWRTLIFTLCVTLFTGLAFGLVPALQATRSDLTPALKEGGDVKVLKHRRLSLRNVLMVCQVSGSLTLLLLTAFLVIGFRGTAGMELGFDPSNLQLISLDPIRDGYSAEQSVAMFPKVLDRVNTLPSVRSASLTESVPMGVLRRGAVMFSSGSGVINSARRYVVGKDYFDTLGIPILRGRTFREEDEAENATAVIVSEQLVHQFFPGEDVLGRRIEIVEDQVARKSGKGRNVAHAYEIVGVARNTKVEFVIEPAKPAIYFPLHPADLTQSSLGGVTLMVRATPGSDTLTAVVREIQTIDSKLTPFDIRTMREQVERMVFVIRLGEAVYGFQGVFGLILAAVGLAGVTAYSVAHRRREIGIRMALGATRRDVLGLVMKESMTLVIVGSAIGLAGAKALTRVLAHFMTSVWRTTSSSSSDPVLLAGGPLLLATMALVACYLPARKSTRIDPMVALRHE
ncbi:ABC transporter related (fragment) [Candidatus Sulfopaludibacter sp. SbA3]